MIKRRDELRDRQQSGGVDALLEQLRSQEQAACVIRDRSNASLRSKRLIVAAELQERLRILSSELDDRDRALTNQQQTNG